MSPPNNSLCLPRRFVASFHRIGFYSLLSSRGSNSARRATSPRRPPRWKGRRLWRRVRSSAEEHQLPRCSRRPPPSRPTHYHPPARTALVPSSATPDHTAQSYSHFQSARHPTSPRPLCAPSYLRLLPHAGIGRHKNSRSPESPGSAGQSIRTPGPFR